MSRILVLATLDTKGEEAGYLADAIRSRGHEVVTMDLSLRGGIVPAEQLEGLERAKAMEVVAAAAAPVLRDLGVDAAVGIGGGTGTWLATEILGALPHGFPKLIVSTLTGRDASRDITVMPSVVDIAGVNRLLAPVLANAAAAICGMAEGVEAPAPPARPTIAVTMFGVTTEGATHLRRFLDEAGCEVVVFHANGAGGKTMERLAREGAFEAVVDWTTSEITDELTGGICTAGPERLEAAGELGIPQVVVPGAVDVINVVPPIPERFADRVHHWHLPTVPLIRTSVDESREIGAWTARKLNAARGTVRVLVPALGFSALDRPGGVFADEAADRAWEDGLRAELRDGIPVEVVPHHINDEAFARAAAAAVLELVGTPTREKEPA